MSSRPVDVRVYKKELTYSIQDSWKGRAEAYNQAVEARSIITRANTRQRAIDAWNTVQANRETDRFQEILARSNAIQEAFAASQRQKPSILTRIYNWFLNIKY